MYFPSSVYLHLTIKQIICPRCQSSCVLSSISIDHKWAVFQSFFFSYFYFSFINIYLFFVQCAAATHQRSAWPVPLCFACKQTVKLDSFMNIQMCRNKNKNKNKTKTTSRKAFWCYWFAVEQPVTAMLIIQLAIHQYETTNSTMNDH